MSKKIIKNIEARIKPAAVVIMMLAVMFSTLFIATNQFKQTAKAADSWSNLDYTTFTETDPGSKITVSNATHLSAASLPSNQDAYVYKSYGVGGITGNFEYQVEFRYTARGGKNADCCVWALSDALNDFYSLVYVSNNKTIGLNLWCDTSTQAIYLISEDGLGESADEYTISINTWYYCTIGRNATTVYCKIYSDKNRVTLLTTLTVDYVSDAYQYLYAIDSWNPGIAEVISLNIQNLRVLTATPDPSTFAVNGLTDNRFVFSGLAGDIAWSNQTGNTVEINMTINSTDNVTGIKVWLGNQNTSAPYHWINVTNVTLYVSSDNSNFGSIGTYTSPGNLSINASTWNAGTMGGDPFAGAGMTDKEVSIWLRVKLTIPVAAVIGTYYGVDCKIYIGYY